MTNLQSAARSAALGGPTNLGADPNHPGLQLPSVPDGLTPGGLVISGTPTGASAPTASGTTVTVQQTAQQAILNWTSFNVGKNTTLNFDQSLGGIAVGTWVAFNKVSDPTGVPSQILGSITSKGQVYIINQNGIIFGGSSQVNVGALVASSLPINDNLITRGLLNNPDTQFLFTALPQAAGGNGTPAFTPPPPPDTPGGKLGDVTVQAGAQLTSPTTAANVGGKIALIGPNVTNSGTISTPDGQTILAAGLQVAFNNHAQSDPTLRGLDVYVGAVVDPSSVLAPYAGTATNSGLIEAQRASVTMTGKMVSQLGVIDSSTSVTLNGRIDLIASYNAVGNTGYSATNTSNGPPYLYQATGTVEFGPGSATQILPETSSTATALGTQLALPSVVNIQGQVVHLASQALLLAPGATLPTGTNSVIPVDNQAQPLGAGLSVNAGTWAYTSASSPPASQFVYTGGQIYLDTSSLINVAGSTDVPAPLSESILTVQLRGAELANSPQQRTSVLRGANLTVDIRNTGTYNGQAWYGTPLGDTTGYAGLVQRTVGELTSAGGSVQFNAGGSVVVQKGATVDVSGGTLANSGGYVKTTRVVSNGHLFDISQATPDLTYDGIYTGIFATSHPTWGVTSNYTVPWMTGGHTEPAYTSGANGGSINITAPTMALDGILLGHTVSGPRQRNPGPQNTAGLPNQSVQPNASSLTLTFQQQQLLPNNGTIYTNFSPTPPKITFQHVVNQAPADPYALDFTGAPMPLRTDRQAAVNLSSDLLAANGFGNLVVNNTDGDIVVPRNVSLTAPPRGSISLSGANVDIQGSITAPGGNITVNVYNIPPSLKAALSVQSGNGSFITTPQPTPGRGMFTLGSSATLNAAGLVVDDRLSAPTPMIPPLVINGGNITINTYSADLTTGSIIDVSGGVAISPKGAITYGAAGSITINTGQDLTLKSVLGGTLNLGATLKGNSGDKGGSLAIQAPLIQIGGNTNNANTLLLQPGFFSHGGFGNYSLTGIGAAIPIVSGNLPAPGQPDAYVPAIVIAPKTVIAPVSQSLVAVLNVPGSNAAIFKNVVKPEGLRTPVSISFNAPGVQTDYAEPLLNLQASDLKVRGDFIMAAGAKIRTDAGATVSIDANTVTVLGSIIAPGGIINIKGANNFPQTNAETSNATTALGTVYLGPQSVLSTAGKVLLLPDAYGRRTGVVLPGGTINVSGNIVAEARAVLNVSGTTGKLDMAPSAVGQTTTPIVPANSGISAPLYSIYTVPAQIDSNGGSISLVGGDELFSDATLLGFAGGPKALGGSLRISSGRFYFLGVNPTPLDITLNVTQNKPTIAVPFTGTGNTGIGRPVLDNNGIPLAGMGYFAADTFQKGGFDSLTLGGTALQFSGPVSIIAHGSLSVGAGGVIYADSAVSLTAPYVKLGTPYAAPLLPQDAAKSNPFPSFFAPSFGPGSITVTASLIDIGNLSLQNIGSLNLIAKNGDIRGYGTLDVAGAIYIEAGQVYPASASTFTIAAYDHITNGVTVPGSVTIVGSGNRPLPLSAGSQMNVYGSIISQGGTLRAPLGGINIGWDGTTFGAFTDPVTNQSVPVTQQLTLGSGSITSVSAIDPLIGKGVFIPYGVNPNGTSWIDPTGTDITAGGAPQKNINIAGLSVNAQSGSKLDIRGGGDVYAYQWITGNGGGTDILGSPSSSWNSASIYNSGTIVAYNGRNWSARVNSTGQTPTVSQFWNLMPQRFAVIPSYKFNYAPLAAFNTSINATNLNGDPGYVSGGLAPGSSLAVGDSVRLGGSSTLPAGNYTLLPARYALLPGAVLVTAQTGTNLGNYVLPDGANLVSGYTFNGLNTTRVLPTKSTRFEIDSFNVFSQRSQYVDYSGNSFLLAGALAVGSQAPRLPVDAGHLVIEGLNALILNGDVTAQGFQGGRGGMVDISSAADITITGAGGTGGPGVVLDASRLNNFGAESLLIGGIRTIGTTGTSVTIRTQNVTVNNASTPLSGPEIILVANNSLTLAPSAVVQQSEKMRGPADSLLIGNAAVPGSGNGLLLRVSSDSSAMVVRAGVDTSTTPKMTIGTGARVSGTSLELDSTYATSIDPSATLSGQFVILSSGQISMQLTNPGQLQPTVGLVLAGSALSSLQAAKSLSLISYSSFDVYGTGGFTTAGKLAIHAAEIRGFNTYGGTAAFTAQSITLDNSGNGTMPARVIAPPSGILAFNAAQITLGANQMNVDQYANLQLNASSSIYLTGSGGLATQSAFTASTPQITAASGATQKITAGGAITIQGAPEGSGASATTMTSGLGASLELEGTNVTTTTNIILPSGQITMHASAGDVIVGGKVSVAGTAQSFYGLSEYTNAGQITLSSETGNVVVSQGASLDVSAAPGGGKAGGIAISASKGNFTITGTMSGTGGAFSLDVGSLPSLALVENVLNAAGFTLARSFHVRSGDVSVDSSSTAQNFSLSTDSGSILVTGNLNASGATGGSISLIASGSVTLAPTAVLSVAGQSFNSAGKGGAVTLEAGSETNGVSPVVNATFTNGAFAAGTPIVDIQAGSSIDLSVNTTPVLGDFSGTLHLRAPQTIGNTNLQINPINGKITNASNILVEGYRLFNLQNTNGTLTNSGSTNVSGGLLTSANNVQGSIKANGTAFAGNTATIAGRLLANNAGLSSVLVVAPGAEVINPRGNLTLGAAAYKATNDWNLSTFRFGTIGVPGVLTLRASGNLVFLNALSDGFAHSTANLYTDPLMSYNPLLPVNLQSWSFNLTAGADLTAANSQNVLPFASLGFYANSSVEQNGGSFLLGRNGGLNLPSSPSSGAGALTSKAVANLYQVIRTGTGDITISTQGDVQLLNQFATIYTAGVTVADPTLGGTFATPKISFLGYSTGALGAIQQPGFGGAYPTQYSLAGGNVAVNAQGNIEHLTVLNTVVTPDSERELPNNWLYRRGFIDPTTGLFGTSKYGDVASTTWWVDFSNFFEGVGALGGGNITMNARQNISNVDAVIPTNARMPGKDAFGNPIAASAASLIELGGGDLAVNAANNIDAGVYYVERGQGTLYAGNTITTNSTRSPTLTNFVTPFQVAPTQAWLPTTLFLGKGSFNVSARCDVLLGPIANTFLLPEGYNNSYWYKTYFSTYATTNSVNVSSLGGVVTLRESAAFADYSTSANGNNTGAVSLLQVWMQNELTFSASTPTASYYQPWLRLDESSAQPFIIGSALLPATLRVTAFSSDVNIVGNLTLSPSPTGTLDLVASGAINGLQPNGSYNLNGSQITTWGSSQINLSDSAPAAIPGVGSPYAYQVLVGTSSPGLANSTNTIQPSFLAFIDNLFAETGSTIGAAGVLQTKQALHGTGLLHAQDITPVHLYAQSGSISGLTLFSGKAADVVAGKDLTDIALYIQNDNPADLTLVSAARDIVPFNANSPLLTSGQAAGNGLSVGTTPQSGDIQISGPGTLEVLAGRNIDLGGVYQNSPATDLGVGITSIGNARNPFLPATGASVIVGAGLGPASAGGLDSSSLGLTNFVSQVVMGPTGAALLAELGPVSGLSTTTGSINSNATTAQALTTTTFGVLPAAQKDMVALELFYLVLRDAGRNHNIAGSPGLGNYTAGFAAISSLFPGTTTYKGDISTEARDILTKSGGDISLFAPGGSLTLEKNLIGQPQTPPGIITQQGGNINIFTNGNVDLGISRIFTLQGGNEIIWSSTGNIAAGASAKTVASAPPTRVIIDPQSGEVTTDLAGLATGGGIGVLATVASVPPGNVDLIAPFGTVDAGDAGIRATGNLNIAAAAVLNASNIQVGGTSTGTPAAPVVVIPNIAGLASSQATAGQSTSTAEEAAKAARPQANGAPEVPSVITVEVLGYGGSSD